MDKVAGGENPASVGARPSSAVLERRDKSSNLGSELSKAQDAGAVDISIASVAADTEEGKLKSLSNLQSVAESIDDAVEVLNQALSLKSTAAVIRRDEELNRYLVTIKDRESGEIVREIPDEALLKFARNLQELRGILFDKTT